MKSLMTMMTVVAFALFAGCDPEARTGVGTRTGALDAALWGQSVWISSPDAPVHSKADGSRAADGTSWFLLRRPLKAARVRKAVWMTTALGTYELFVNGRAVGEEFLKPGFTHVKKTRRSFTYDVTEAVNAATRPAVTFAAAVSAGWWRDKIVNFHGKKSAFRAVLAVEYNDGTSEVIGTNTEDWRAVTAGPVTHAAIFDGEEYDARKPAPYLLSGGWEATRVPEVNDEFKGEILPTDGAEVYLRTDLAIRRGPFSLKSGEKLVVDFGQNLAGVPVFRFKARCGTVLTCLPGEMLNDAEKGVRGCDGPKGSVYRANLRVPAVGMRLKYTFAGGEDYETYIPRFTFFGYRYVELSADGDVEIAEIASVPVTSVTKAMEIGSLETGDPSLNRFIANVRWGMLSNYLSVPTDCPQRNERLGWTADTQVFADAGAYIADTRDFFSKWTRDLRDSRSPKGGSPGVAPWAQYGAEENCMMRIGWSDAMVIVPWKIWRQFGDRRIVDENWAAMESFADHVNATKYDHEAIRKECGDYQWSDWLSLDRFESASSGRNPEFDAFFMKDGKRVRREGVVEYWDYLGAAYWAIDAGMMRDMALATGRPAEKWLRMEAEAKAYLKGRYFRTPDGCIRRPYDTMQTPAVFALKLGLVEGAAKEKTIAFLRADLQKRGNVTGFLGSSWLMDVLCENGMADIAVNRLLSHEFPSWLYSVDQGATTVWERWNGWTKDRGFGPVGMNSYNHYAYGAVLAWMYRSLAGIAPDVGAPGFLKIVMKPVADRRLGFVKASYRSAAGLITSEWRFDGDEWIWNFTVPEGATALVTVPGDTAAKEYKGGNHTIVRKGIRE